jgi:predicted PurR-regulated permease PerM
LLLTRPRRAAATPELVVNIEPKSALWSVPRGPFRTGARDRSPFQDPAAFWRVTAQTATIAMAAIMIGAFLYVARSLLVPILAALVVSLTLGPLAARAQKKGLPAWLPAGIIVVAFAAALYGLVNTLVAPASELIARSGEIGDTIREKFRFMERPLFALRELQAAVIGSSGLKVDVNQNTLVEAAIKAVPDLALQLVLFFATLFFFVFGRSAFRRYVVNLFTTRDGRLRSLRIINDIEHNLSLYLITVTLVNIGVGCAVTALTYALGFPTPLLWGALAFVLNYIPYIGPGVMHVTLFVIGLLTFPTLAPALVAPLLFMTFTFFEGHFLVPALVGRQMLLHPLAVFLSLAFWAWLWGPIGALLATPILIMGIVALDHLYPRGSRLLPA